MKKILFITSFIVFVFLSVSRTEAAVLFMTPKSGELKIGQTFNLDIKVNTEGQAFNAAEATIRFPKDVLEVKSIDTSPAATIFNFWLEGPSFFNQEGKITFIGGTTSGVSGSSIPILKIVFAVKGGGAADIVFSDAAVTASDGSGTNILFTMEIARLTVSPTVVLPSAKPAPPEMVLPTPIPVTRAPVKAEILPEKPKISVSLYSNEEKWYNLTADFLVNWELPADISDVNAALDRNFSYFNRQSEGLFKSKVFPAIAEDGVWYLHARFKNNVGWGPVANYRIAIDTQPPQPFKADILEGPSTDNPSPTLRFRTNDGLSGLENYLVRIDGGDLIALPPDTGEFKLPLQPPGKHVILVKAADKAGNSTEDSVDLEILPIASPTVNLINKDIFAGEGNLAVGGTAIANIELLLSVKDLKNKIFISEAIKSDAKGNWEKIFDQPLRNGKYKIEAQARDSRGALSLPATSEVFKVSPKPLFTIGGFGVTQGALFSGLLVILLGGFGAGWFSYRLWRVQLERKAIVAERDVAGAFDVVRGDLDQMLAKYADRRVDEREAAEIEFRLKKIKANLEKTQKYIEENIDEIPD
jgi:hypothetical protein